MVVFLQDQGHSDPIPLADALEVMKARLGLARSDVVGVVRSRWQELLGDDLSVHCELTSIRDGVMGISVDDPAIADALRWMSGDLVSASNDICGGAFITDVRITVARR